MKSDARVKFTKKVIRGKLFTLLRDKPINKISVTTICDLAEINRATFYRYYSDPYDLLRQIEEDFIQSLKDLVQKTGNKNIIDIMLMILGAIYQNGSEYAILISENGGKDFSNRLIQECYSVKKEDLKELFPNYSPHQRQWIFSFMIDGFTSILKNWVQNGMKEDPVEIAKFINKINNVVLTGLK